MNVLNKIVMPALVLVVIVAMSCVFTVNETELAIKLRLGEIQRSDYTPGLYFKFPLVNNILKFERRLLNLDTNAERFLTAEKKDVIVDSFVRWRIINVEAYFKATGGDERKAGLLLHERINDGLRGEFGNRTVKDVVTGGRGDITTSVKSSVNRDAMELGMVVVDVRLKRIDLPTEVSNSVYQRMRAERERTARKLRSEGSKKAEETRAGADRERTVILANAYRKSEIMRGEGDAVSAAFYAKAYDKDREFYAFYRRLNAYRESFSDNKDNILVLSPEGDFFRYFGDSMGSNSEK